jgi:hypothetical protein
MRHDNLPAIAATRISGLMLAKRKARRSRIDPVPAWPVAA